MAGRSTYDNPSDGPARRRVSSSRLGRPWLPLLAIMILAFSFSVLAHNLATERAAGRTFEVNGVTFEWTSLEEGFVAREIDGRVGYSLSDLVNSTGLVDGTSHDYRIIGADGYQKTVGWQHMLEGIIMIEGKEVYFPGLPQQFHVHDVVEIQVV